MPLRPNDGFSTSRPNARQQGAASSPARQTSPAAAGHCTVESRAILDTGDTGTSCSLDDFTCAPGQTIARRAVTPWLPLQLVTQRQSNMARLNPGSVAAMVLAAIVVLLLGAGSYMVSSRMNRDAETVGN